MITVGSITDWVGKDVRVAVDKKLAKDAPSIQTDGQLESAMEPAVSEHYELVYPVLPGSAGKALAASLTTPSW